MCTSTSHIKGTESDENAVFIFVIAGTTLTTCADSNIVLLNGARADSVYWVRTALTMGAGLGFSVGFSPADRTTTRNMHGLEY